MVHRAHPFRQAATRLQPKEIAMRAPSILLLITAIAAGCTSTGKPGLSASAAGSPSSGAGPSSGPSAPSPALNQDGGTPGSDLLLVRRDNLLEVVEGENGHVLYQAPPGTTTSNWQEVYGATPRGTTTHVVAGNLIAGGQIEREADVVGTWVLPTIGLDRVSDGLSLDGRTLVLAEARPEASRTRFAILATDFSAPARVITLAGRFTFDGLSPDGSRIYVIEELPGKDGKQYAVRSVLASGKLEEGVIVDKRNGDEAMAGTPIERKSDGAMAYTLYLGEDGPFVHALDTANRVAFCIDLPAAWGKTGASLAGWATAFTPDRANLYVANPGLGVIAEVDVHDLEVARSATFSPTATLGAATTSSATTSVELVKFAGTPGPAGTAAVSPDGKTLYVLDSKGVLVISTSDLKPRTRLLKDRNLIGMAASPDGQTLYVVARDGTGASVDATSGAVKAPFDGTGYQGIVVVMREGG
jgi:hypothetical protein